MISPAAAPTTGAAPRLGYLLIDLPDPGRHREHVAQMRRSRGVDDGTRTRGARLRLLAQLLFSLLMAVGALVVLAPASQAGLYNPIPMNSEEEPDDQFVDDDALFVYVTSDIKGGRVCIVEATVEAPADGSCDRPAWGSPNDIVGIGSIIQPIEGPSLIPGTWRILAEDSEGTPTAVSVEFTVTSCFDCSREPALAKMREWKDRAEQMRTGVGLACIAFSVKDAADSVTAARGKIKKAQQRADRFEAGEVGFKATIIPAAGGLMGFAFPSFDAIGAGQDKALEILHDLSCATAAMYADIVADPPDPDFEVVPTPSFATIGPSDSPVLDELMSALDRQSAFAEVSLSAYEKYLGATEAGDDEAAAAQLRAAGRFALSQVTQMRRSADALTAYADLFRSTPDATGPLLSAEEWTTIKGAYDRVRQGGFAPEETAALTAAGRTPAQIEAIRSHFEVPLGGFDPEDSLVDQLDALAATTVAAVPGFDEFGREAIAVAARIEGPVQPPNTTPVATSMTLTVERDTSLPITLSGTDADGDALTFQVVDPPTLGTLQGSGAQRTYVPNPGAVGQDAFTFRANDGQASSEPATVSITITPPTPVNRPPIAVSQTVYLAQGASYGGPFYGYDPDGQPVTYDVVTPPTYGTVTEVGGQWTYTPDPGFRGTDGAVFTASDGTLTSDAAVTTFKVGNPDGISVGNEIFTVGRGLTLTANVLSNDTSPNGGVHLVSSTPASDGTATCDLGLGTCTYTADGTATSDSFTYTVADGAGQTAVGRVSVTIVDDNQPPVIVGADTATADEGSSFSYSYTVNDPDGAIVSTVWTTPTGYSGASQPTFADEGTYTTTLTVTDNRGAATSKDIRVTVANQPPSFSYGGPNGRWVRGRSLSMNVYAWDPGPQDVLTATWDFGDGQQATGMLVEHTWTDNGTYPVTVTVTDGDGGRAEQVVATIVIRDVVLDAGPTVSGDEGAALAFDFTGSTAPDSGLIYTVDWGDGRSEAWSGGPAQHRYASPGSYEVRLSAVDHSDGSKEYADTTTATVANLAPTKAAIAEHAVGRTGEPLGFRAYWTDPGGPDPATVISWSFGDGATASGRTAEHAYTAAGTYDVTVTVTEDDGKRVTRTDQVHVLADVDRTPSSAGREFWVTFDANYQGTEDSALTLFVASSTATSGVVEVPGLVEELPFTVAANDVTAVSLPIDVRAGVKDTNAQRVEPLAVHVVADDAVTVYGLNRQKYTTDAFLAVPVTAVGTRYRVVDYEFGLAPVVGVVATEGRTTVTIDPPSPSSRPTPCSWSWARSSSGRPAPPRA